MKKFILSICLFSTLKLLSSEQMVLIDPYLSPYAGAANLLAADAAVINLKDKILPPKNGEVITRTLEQLLLWTPICSLTTVAQHEIFGHGYRLRSLGVTPHSYTVSIDGGATYFSPGRDFEAGKMLAVDVAGLEAESILAWDLKMKWMKERGIDGKLSSLYFFSQQSLLFYTLITRSDRKNHGDLSGNDIESYLKIHRILFPEQDLSLGSLSKWAFLNLLDPMTFYSCYAYFYYIKGGQPLMMPMLNLKEDLYYLPNIKVGFAPYAPEAYFENFILYQDLPIYFYIKGGKRSFGIGGVYDYLLFGSWGHLGFKFDLWNQGHFMSTLTMEQIERPFPPPLPEILSKRAFGGALSLRGSFRFGEEKALFAEVGGKTSGYLPGYGLEKGAVVRIGLQFGLSPHH